MANMSGQLPPTPSPMKHPVRDPLESAGEARSSLVSVERVEFINCRRIAPDSTPRREAPETRPDIHNPFARSLGLANQSA